MRVSTFDMQRQAVNTLLSQQYELNRLQHQLSTGERFSVPAEDPIAAVTVLDLDEALTTTKQYMANANVAKTRLNVAEVSLNDFTEKLQRVRELTVQAANDTVNNKDRQIIAKEIRLIRDGLVELANSKDPDGEYLFSGYQGRTIPFVKDAAGEYVYQGDEGQRLVRVGPSRLVALSDNGKDLFVSIKRAQAAESALNAGDGTITVSSITQPRDYQAHHFTITFSDASTFDVVNNSTGQTVLSGQTYVKSGAIEFNGTEVRIDGDPQAGDTFVVAPDENTNVFDTLTGLIDDLENAPSDIADLAEFRDGINNALNDIDQSMESVLVKQTEVGARQNTITSQDSVNEAVAFQMEKSISELKDLDFVTAISQFNLQMTALQAAQQSYVKVQGLALFNYL